MYRNARLSLSLSCHTHTPQMSTWRLSLRLDSFCRCLPLNPSILHCSLLVSLFWWHLFSHNRFTFCSLYNNYYFRFSVNKYLIAAKVDAGKDRGKHSSSPTPSSGVPRQQHSGIWKENPFLFAFISYCCNDSEFLALWFIIQWKSPNICGPQVSCIHRDISSTLPELKPSYFAEIQGAQTLWE